MEKIFFKALLCIFISALSCRAELNCDQQLVESDHCLKKLLFIGDWNLTFVESEADMIAHCKMVKEKMSCIKNYKKCLHGVSRELFNMVSQRSREIFQDRCGSAKGRQIFLHHIQCLDSETSKVSQCMDKMIILLNYIAEEVDGNREELLTASCCAGHYLVNCFMTKIAEACKHMEGHSSAQFMVEKINGLVAGSFEIACSRLPSLEVCEKDHPKLMEKFHSLITPEDKLEKQSMSPLMPLVKIGKKLKL